MKVLAMFFCVLAAGMATAGGFDDCRALHGRWSCHPGGEYPGASASLAASEGRLRLGFDFSGGGAYVACVRVLPESVGEAVYEVAVTALDRAVVFCRVTDAAGRVFQTGSVQLDAGDAHTFRLERNTAWAAAWNGGESESPQAPWRDFQIGVDRNGSAISGQLRLDGISSEGTFAEPADLQGEAGECSAFGWRLRWSWGGAVDAPLLLVEAEGGDADAVLTCTRATGDRPVRSHYFLKAGMEPTPFEITRFAPSRPGETSEYAAGVAFDPALEAGGNDYNRYRVELALETSDGRRAAVHALLSGGKSSGVNFGAPRSSEDIRHLPVGVNAHLLYASLHPSSQGAGYRKLIDRIAEAGFKYIRDSAQIERGEDGAWRVRPYDIEWISYARSRGIATILLMLEINYYQDYSFDDMIDIGRAYARELKGLVDIYEIGNETNWSGLFPGGTWNAMVSATDPATCRSVLELTAMQNRIADAMAEVNPDAVLLGLGQGTAVNYRMIEAGLSPNLDGVVEHAYTFSLPPEKDVWANNFERDGIDVDNPEASFFGMIDSYLRKLAATGMPRPLWITEFGFPNHSASDDNHTALYAPFSEEAVTVYTLRRFLMTLYRQDAVKANIHYDIMRGALHDADPEQHFGMLDSDYSPTSTYCALQRMNSLFAETLPDFTAEAEVLASPLHRSAVRNDFTRWDDVEITLDNQVMVLPFRNPETPDERMAAVWSAQPYSGEFNPRFVRFQVSGWTEFNHPLAVGIDLVNGETFDVPVRADGDAVVVDRFHIGQHPCVIKFFKE